MIAEATGPAGRRDPMEVDPRMWIWWLVGLFVVFVAARTESFPGGLFFVVVAIVLASRWIRAAARQATRPDPPSGAGLPDLVAPSLPDGTGLPPAGGAPAPASVAAAETADPALVAAVDRPVIAAAVAEAEDPDARAIEAAAERLRDALDSLERRRANGLITETAYEAQRARLIQGA